MVSSIYFFRSNLPGFSLDFRFFHLDFNTPPPRTADLAADVSSENTEGYFSLDDFHAWDACKFK